MSILPRLKDSAIYAWNADSTLRSWVETRKYPPGCNHRHCGLCLTCRYLVTKQEKEQERRDEIVSNIDHNRRVRRLRSRKRDVSVDGGWRKKRGAGEQKQCLLLAMLPAELRIQIWEEVLCGAEEICIVPGRLAWDRLNVRAERKCFPQMLRTCRQIYREAVPILYSGNTFTFHSPSTLYTFTASIVFQRLAQIQNFTLATVLLGHTVSLMDVDDAILYRDPFQAADYAKIIKLFSKLVVVKKMKNRKGNLCLSYRIANKTYMDNPRSRHFGLLRQFEIGGGEKMKEGYKVVYEIVGAVGDGYEGGDGVGELGREGLLFGRWKVRQRVNVEYKMS